MAFYRQTILLVVSFYLFLSGRTQVVSDSTNFFNSESFFGDTLFIKARFMECGEWGGHIEISKIYLKDHEFYLCYEKYSADCNTTKENNGEPVQTLIKVLNKKMLKKDKRIVSMYFHQLLDAKFREPMPMHAGYIFEIEKTDKSIYLIVHTWGSRTKNEYIRFIEQLFD